MEQSARPAARGERYSPVDPRVMDPRQELFDYGRFDEGEMDQIVAVLEAMRAWRAAERRSSEAARRYMKLGETDMRALRFLMAVQRHGDLATPSMLARHLGISTASVTKMMDRLEDQGHLSRRQHPGDRRSTAIEITEDTAAAARRTVGNTHVSRIQAVSELTPEERDVVLRFLTTLAEEEFHSPE
ncbi:MAG: MarR family winged helix-turn-helix transcriptional regulator [Micrococcaceae bacterium]|uniref:MarR family transcriptional regulator n=1 Tax=Citricoccus muralis TaxID=169134 RepID=A0ABY8H4A6_9MICC|nr:MarR family transcriptional regulator [Citricoccus muralis]WFP15550.1 MarR family transcriptional regulator [Citricoccus muralis]